MTDWDEMVENITRAMEALGEAHASAKSLQREANASTFELFRQRMKALEEHLRRLQQVLDNEEAHAIDELMDALSRVYTNHAADYRSTPRLGM